ncbi:MAG: hypothetical protein KKA60_08900 [Proteobacteria bacterium]|nr:hypothetical protein [Pseudomonadota bacterium]
MSGIQNAQARLAAALKNRLNSIVSAREALEEVRAETESARESCRAFEEDLREIMASAVESSGGRKKEEADSVASNYLPESFEAFQEKQKALEEAAAGFEALDKDLAPFIQKAGQARADLKEMDQALTQAQQKLNEAQEAGKRVHEASREVEAAMGKVMEDLPEAVAQGRSNEFAQRELRRQLRVLLHTWNRRAQSEPHLHRWAAGGIRAKLKEGDKLAKKSGDISPEAIEKLKESLQALENTARANERANLERLEVGRRVDTCLQDAGFRRNSRLPDPSKVGAEPLFYEHSIANEQYQGTIGTKIPHKGRIELHMQGESGANAMAIERVGPQPMERCGESLEDLIYRLREVGVVVSDVVWVPPDGGEEKTIFSIQETVEEVFVSKSQEKALPFRGR